MNEAIAKRWVEALRSGEFQQTRSTLRDDEGGKLSYCCLGVLTELHRREAVSQGLELLQENLEEALKNLGLLPSATWQWSEMAYQTGMCKPALPETLVEMNDRGVPFSAIADAIEKHWREL